jgi:hypothetical protein
MILATLLTLVLALAVLGRLIWGRWNPSLVIGILIGLALAVVIRQRTVDQAKPPIMDPGAGTKPVEAERQAREKDVATLNAHLDQIKAALPRLDDDIRQVNDQLSKLDGRVKKLEHPPPPPPPLSSPVTLISAQVDLVQPRGKSPKVPAYSGTFASAESKVVSADIDFCQLPVNSNGCVPAPPTPGCDHNFICNERGGNYATIPSPILAHGRQFCVRMTFSLQNGAQGVALGGPLEPHNGSKWQRDAKTPTVCDTVADNQSGRP